MEKSHHLPHTPYYFHYFKNTRPTRTARRTSEKNPIGCSRRRRLLPKLNARERNRGCFMIRNARARSLHPRRKFSPRAFDGATPANILGLARVWKLLAYVCVCVCRDEKRRIRRIMHKSSGLNLRGRAEWRERDIEL